MYLASLQFLRMIRLTALLVFIFFTIAGQCQQSRLNETINTTMALAAEQYVMLDHTLPDSLFPRNIGKEEQLVTNKSGWWTSGFSPVVYGSYMNIPRIQF